jgi:aldose sugar dehydrogenase
MPRWSGLLAPSLLVLTVLAGCASDGGPAQADGGTTPPPGDPPVGAPELQVNVMAEGLDHPWDVVQAPDGTLLVDERSGGLTAVRAGGGQQEVAADFGDLFADGETGLMGLELDPGFADTRRFYTCQGVTDGGPDGGPSIEVIAWQMAPDWTTARRVDDPLIGGIPVNADSGRHGGCRLEIGPDGALYIGTGDNAVGSNPQDVSTLAGKVLRADPLTGDALPDNPFAGSGDDADDLIWTYGHRNVQGLAVRPGTEQIYSVEHGPDRDDEVNLLVPGANQGWDPSDGGGYDEGVPMTDPDLAEVSPALWQSGAPTIAPSGGTFLEGEGWGDYDGLMVIGVLKDTGVLALRLSEDGTEVVEQFRIPELEDEYGRIRAVELGEDGFLYVTTDNGDDNDVLLRVTPS